MDLRIARRIAGLTQLELANKVGVDDSFISMLENGKRDIRTTEYRTVVRLARALNVTPEELFPIPPQDEPDREVKGAPCPSAK
jgi:transcriptional regulator with XRE-family HTH domain